MSAPAVPAIGTQALPVPAQAAQTDRIALTDALLVSDLHLAVAMPRTLARWQRFLDEDAAQHAELVILGDLFERWLGDDAPDAVGVQVAQALRQLTDGGCVVYLMHGNRDLLLGRAFCERTGATLLADPTRAQLPDGRTVLLAHGDTFCTLDTAYMAFRAQVRDPLFQRTFLAGNLAERLAFIGKARGIADAEKQAKSMQIMDVTPAEIDRALRAAGLACLIHGHTHRPATHRWLLDGAPVERWVLPDWDFDGPVARGGYLHASATGVQRMECV